MAEHHQAQMQADILTLTQIVEGLDRLEAALDTARPGILARQRGYFAPDEDDRVRQLLLAYRNYRLCTHEIVNRYRAYEAAGSLIDQLRGFIIGYAAALTLYAKSQKVISAYRHEPLVRAKLNEPEFSFGVEPGFFEAILASYTSLPNYAAMVHAEQFWRRHRRDVRHLGLAQEPGIGRLCDVIRRHRPMVHRDFHRAIGDRMVHRFRMLRDLALRPVADARYGLQALAFNTLANLHAPIAPPCFDHETVGQLRSRLRAGDVLLTRTEQKLTSAILPGFWIHAALYMGTAADLERMDLVNQPVVRRNWDQIQAAAREGCVVEAISPQVTISSLDACLNVDHVAVLRPRVGDAERVTVILESLRHLGKPYDFEFDFNQTRRIVCTGLIYRSFDAHGAGRFALVKHLGRYALTCDELCAQALAVESRHDALSSFDLAALVLQAADGRPHMIPESTALDHLRAIQGGLKPSRELRF